MFKPLIAFTIFSFSLSGIVHGQEQEKKERSVPAFLMPATVARTTTSPSGPAGNPEPDAAVAETTSTHKLEYRDPNSGARRALLSTKPIRIADGAKQDSKPVRSAGEQKSAAK